MTEYDELYDKLRKAKHKLSIIDNMIGEHYFNQHSCCAIGELGPAGNSSDNDTQLSRISKLSDDINISLEQLFDRVRGSITLTNVVKKVNKIRD